MPQSVSGHERLNLSETHTSTASLDPAFNATDISAATCPTSSSPSFDLPGSDATAQPPDPTRMPWQQEEAIAPFPGSANPKQQSAMAPETMLVSHDQGSATLSNCASKEVVDLESEVGLPRLNATPALLTLGTVLGSEAFATNNEKAVASNSKRGGEASIASITNPLPMSTWNQDIFDRHTEIPWQFSLDNNDPTLPFTVSMNNQNANFAGHWLDFTCAEEFKDPAEEYLHNTQFQQEYLEKWWKFQDMSGHLIKQELFIAGYKAGVRSEYYSSFALHAVLACAVRLSDDDSVRKIGPTFAAMAKNELSQELERPNLATVQGFCALADFECTNGSEQAGWAFVGIACRLVLDLGLDQDYSQHLANKLMSKNEALARHQTAVGTFVYEQMWCLFLGRPSHIKSSSVQQLRHLPTVKTNHNVEVLSTWLGLSAIINRMIDIFSRPQVNDRKWYQNLKQLRDSFTDWLQDLPPGLKWDGGPQPSWTPMMCMLCMQYHHSQILYHKIVTASLDKFWPDGISQHEREDIWPFTAEMSKRIMYENAVQIAQILEFRRSNFELWGFATLMLDIIFTAATTLITCMTTERHFGTALKNFKWLLCFLEPCESLQGHYPVVKRMLAALDALLDANGLAKFIWKGLTPNSTDCAASSTHSELALSTPQSSVLGQSGPSKPFDATRWCRGAENEPAPNNTYTTHPI